MKLPCCDRTIVSEIKKNKESEEVHETHRSCVAEGQYEVVLSMLK